MHVFVRECDTFYNEKEKIWYGPKETAPLFNPDCSIGCVLFHIMKLKPKAVALVSDTEGTSVTYEELLRDSVRIALCLRKLVPNREDKVGLVAGHTTLSTHIQLACLFNTTIFHPVNPAHDQVVLEHLYAKTRPKIIFCDGKYYEKVLSACEVLKLAAKIYTITSESRIEGVASIEELMQPNLDEETFKPTELVDGRSQTLLILNSSGTSGLPKASCFSNYFLCLRKLSFHENVTFISVSPLDWVSSIYYIVHCIYSLARRVLTLNPYTPEHFVQLVEKYKINKVLLSPVSLACLVHMNDVEKADLSSLDSFFVGGSMISPTINVKFRKLLKDKKRQYLSFGYGSTELCGVVTNNDNIEKPQSVGKIQSGMQVKIINEDGENLGVGETGEILAAFRGIKWNGYYGDPEETSKMLDKELWFHTGDIGYFDKDGDLFVVDRKKDILKYRGVQYSTHDIEEIISQLPDVMEVCVFGIPKDTIGDDPAAAIVRRNGSKLTEEEVIRYAESMSEVAWKRLGGGVFFVNSLPKTPSGKILRRDVMKLALGKGA